MEQIIYKGLIAFVKQYTNIEQNNIRQGFQNRTGLSQGDFCLITFLNSEGNMRPITNLKTGEITEHSELLTALLQFDFYGNNGFENISKIKTLLFDDVGCEFLKNYGIQPIEVGNIINHTGDTKINEQYYKRYSIDIKINYYNDVSLTEARFDNVLLTTKRVN